MTSDNLSEVDEFLISSKLEGALHSSLLHPPPLTPSRRNFLIMVLENPGASRAHYASLMGVADSVVGTQMRREADADYVVRTGPKNAFGAYTITDKGIDALRRAAVKPEKRAKLISRIMSDYEPYDPPPYDHAIIRPGSMDAYYLPSRTAQGLVWPDRS